MDVFLVAASGSCPECHRSSACSVEIRFYGIRYRLCPKCADTLAESIKRVVQINAEAEKLTTDHRRDSLVPSLRGYRSKVTGNAFCLACFTKSLPLSKRDSNYWKEITSAVRGIFYCHRCGKVI